MLTKQHVDSIEWVIPRMSDEMNPVAEEAVLQGELGKVKPCAAEFGFQGVVEIASVNEDRDAFIGHCHSPEKKRPEASVEAPGWL